MAHVQEVLAGRYELLDVLGRGGMGVVYKARDHVLGRDVAVKVLPVDRAEDPALVARFEREAKAAAGLNHPNVVSVYDTGRDADTRFIVMECVPGVNLAELLRERGRLPAAEAVRIAAQIAAALVVAHRAGLIHRDIKPANVMVDGTDRVRVLDFGIVRATGGTSLTQTANVVGSAPYLAPEVARGAPADERADVYSLGCVLYEMLTGRPPFTGEHPAAIMHQHTSTAPPPPRELNPAVPPELDALVLSMLVKDPARRPADAQLAALLAAAPSPTRTAATAPLPIPTVHGRQAGLALAGLLAVVVLAVALLSSSGSPPTHRRAAPVTRPAPSRPAATTTTVTATQPSAPAPAAPAPPQHHGHGGKGDKGKGDKGKGGGKGGKD